MLFNSTVCRAICQSEVLWGFLRYRVRVFNASGGFERVSGVFGEVFLRLCKC